MTNNSSQFVLIDGTFSPENAKKLLSSLISNKIQFHNLDDFSTKIRFDNDDDSKSKSRIEALTKTRDELFYLIELAQKINMDIVIDSKIDIRFEPNKI